MEEKVKIIVDILQFALLLIAAIWGYFKVWKEGLYRPRIQFDIDCKVFNSDTDEIPIEIILKINNRGLLKHKFHSILIRARAIKSNQALAFWQGNEPRLYFPEKTFEAEVIYKSKYSTVFVEPGIDQTLTFVTKISKKLKYIIIRAEFNYDESKTHSIEKFIEIGQNDSNE